MATNVFDMPAALFARYLEFFNIEHATPMHTWDQGTRNIYENLTANFGDKIHLNAPVRKVHRQSSYVVIEDEDGVQEEFDDVIFACNAGPDVGDLRRTHPPRTIYSLFGALRRFTSSSSDSPQRPDGSYRKTNQIHWKRGAITSSSMERNRTTTKSPT